MRRYGRIAKRARKKTHPTALSLKGTGSRAREGRDITTLAGLLLLLHWGKFGAVYGPRARVPAKTATPPPASAPNSTQHGGDGQARWRAKLAWE